MKTQRPPRPVYFVAVMAATLTAALLPVSGCGEPSAEADVTPYSGDGPDYPAVSSDLGCVSEYRRAGGLFLLNFLGLTEEAVKVAESDEGGVFPVGTLIQGIPNEAMLKRGPGFSPDTGDWEYILLENDGATTTITSRGTTEVENAGGSCAACHNKAEPQWDAICQQDHGCDPIPASLVLFQTLRDADRRCGREDIGD